VGKRWVRPVVITALLGLSAFLLYAGAQSKSDVKPPVKRAGIGQVFPEPSAVAVRQDAIGADLDFDWSGRLRVDNHDIPDDQLDKIAGINRLSFTPGPEKEIVTLDEGRHCVNLIYWKSAEGEGQGSRTYTWCFTSA
jgi:hypothetical protein